MRAADKINGICQAKSAICVRGYETWLTFVPVSDPGGCRYVVVLLVRAPTREPLLSLFSFVCSESGGLAVRCTLSKSRRGGVGVVVHQHLAEELQEQPEFLR